MDFENGEDISNYVLLLDMAENIVSLLGTNEEKHYPTIQQEIMKCSQKIHFLIALEATPSFLIALFQQKQQLSILMKLTEGIIDQENHFMNKRLQNTTNNYKHFKILYPQQTIQLRDGGTVEKLQCLLQDIIASPKVRGLHEIIGLNNVKKTLRSLILLPKTQPQLFYNCQNNNTILLYGPPGTGKTRLAHGIAAEANGKFLCISAGDILSHYVGETEKTIKLIFKYLNESNEFIVLFIDEIDAFCRIRTNNEQDYTRRLKTEFMCQMSNIEDKRNLFIICATNCPWDIDPAILRRLHKRIYIPLPNQLERLEIFHYLTNSIYFDENLGNWDVLLEKTKGYSGSDIFDIVQNALMIPLNELEDTKVWKRCNDGFFEPVLGEDFSTIVCSELRDLPSNSVRARKVHMNDLLKAAESVKSTVSQNDVKKYEIFNG